MSTTGSAGSGWCLALGEPARENRLRADVVSSMYLGELEEFVLATGGQTFKVVIANPAGDAPRPGMQRWISFAAEDAVIVADRTP